jgi:deazaflavin-dependent oxidoreductase (nitroreductase family)
MRTVLVAIAVLGTAIGALGLGFVWAFRTKFGPVMRAIRRLNRAVTNPMQLRGDAGQPGAYASVVHHVGRRSGTHYRTPVGAVETGVNLAVVLPYGPDTDWVRNLTAAGGGTVEHEGRRISVGAPVLVDIAEVDTAFPPKDRRTHRRFGVRQAVRLPIVATPDATGQPASTSSSRS